MKSFIKLVLIGFLYLQSFDSLYASAGGGNCSSRLCPLKVAGALTAAGGLAVWVGLNGMLTGDVYGYPIFTTGVLTVCAGAGWIGWVTGEGEDIRRAEARAAEAEARAAEARAAEARAARARAARAARARPRARARVSCGPLACALSTAPSAKARGLGLGSL